LNQIGSSKVVKSINVEVISFVVDAFYFNGVPFYFKLEAFYFNGVVKSFVFVLKRTIG